MGKLKYSTISNMTSVITADIQRCICCQMPATECHHVFEGPDRKWSEKYGLMIPLCSWCHYQIHQDQNMNEYYKRIAQGVFEKTHSREDFIKHFRRNYI